MKLLRFAALSWLVVASAHATTWTTTSTDKMLRSADLVAVCEVVQYPCNQLKEDQMMIPGYIKLKVVQTLRGTENDRDLLVHWVDFTQDATIKQGMRCVVFLWRGERGKTVDNWGVPTNATYSRFNSPLWLREVSNGKIQWERDQRITVEQLTQLVNAKMQPAARTPRS